MVTIRQKENTACCGQSAPCSCKQTAAEVHNIGRINARWSDGVVTTEVGEIPRVRSELNYYDRLGIIRARWGVGRMNYRVAPGLYAVGNPGAESHVLVTANYKLSFDKLRSVLANRNAWILVLDTKGINVWCAAGKGTFGTDEIVRRIQISGLDRIVSHRKLILPQLGAPGVSAHLVREQCGFRVIYGPVRAQDLPAFLDAGLKAEPEMRRMRFRLRDRAILIPVEIVAGAKYVLLAAAALLLLSGLNAHGYSLANVRSIGFASVIMLLAAFLGGMILGPLLLPWLPSRTFSLKGAVLGCAMFGASALFGWLSHSLWHVAAWALIVPTITSFSVMNFTGTSTFTSLSGVLYEMRFALPAQIAGGAAGLGCWIAGLFLSGGSLP
jgi:hypothetical protein